MHSKKKVIYVVVFTMILLLSLTGCADKNEHTLKKMNVEELKEEKEIKKEIKKEEKDKNTTTIFVYICGAVVTEGVYELPNGSRLYEGILKAGGMKAEAAKTYLNQAEVLEDGQRVYVPATEEVAILEQESTDLVQSAEEEKPTTLKDRERKVNLNTATKEELMTLTGIGETKAESIIRYREENGRFTAIEDLKSIVGIKDGVFHKIKDMIIVS
ncbi:MAG: helix-hairpin-helix domain-containing protein [Lachnospiraceae bacterium]